MLTTAGIVLCGGASRRMGRPKAHLPFGSELLLGRVVRIVAEAVRPVLVVSGPRHSLPRLPGQVVVVRDPQEHLGPLAGLANGMSACPPGTDAVFVTGCDTPFLTPDLVQLLLERAATGSAAVPVVAGRRQPLPAVYPVAVAEAARRLLRLGQGSLTGLLEHVAVREVSEAELRQADPQLLAFQPMNTPEDYAAAQRLLASSPFNL